MELAGIDTGRSLRRPNAMAHWFATVALIIIAVVASLFAGTSPALAHAELRGASPASNETVGGAIHSVSMLFFDLDETKVPQAQVFDAAGNPLGSQLNQDGQLLVIALIDPISTPGDYLVRYAVWGLDGDFTDDSYSFSWAEGAPEASPIEVESVGFDIWNFVLLMAAAALAAFLVHRFMMAMKEHRAAQTSQPSAEGAPPDQVLVDAAPEVDGESWSAVDVASDADPT